MYKRVAYIEIITASGNMKRLDGLNVRFNVNKRLGAVMNDASISIANLTRDDVEYLTTFTSPWYAIAQHKRIRLFAGYEDTNTGLLFDGDIIEAMPTMPPDVWLNCKARSGNYGNCTMVSKSIQTQMPVKQLLKEASGWTGLTLEDTCTSEKSVSGFNFNGGVTQVIEQLNQIGGITVFEDNGTLKAVDTDNPNINATERVISKSSGMIGMPKLDPLGCEVTVLLDPTIKLGQKVRVISERIPSASGSYWVYDINYTGETRGEPFYTVLKCRRFSV